MLELACLYCEVRRRYFSSTPLNTYCEAMREVGVMASAMGYTIHDLAKVATYAE